MTSFNPTMCVAMASHEATHGRGGILYVRGEDAAYVRLHEGAFPPAFEERLDDEMARAPTACFAVERVGDTLHVGRVEREEVASIAANVLASLQEHQGARQGADAPSP
jgi:hypothetical protein